MFGMELMGSDVVCLVHVNEQVKFGFERSTFETRELLNFNNILLNSDSLRQSLTQDVSFLCASMN